MSFDFTQEASATISTSEYSLPANTSTGVPTVQTDTCQVQPMVSIAAMASGDEYLVQLYEKITPAGSQIVLDSWRMVYPQDKLILPAFIVHNGWDITMKKISGTDRSVSWSLRKVK